MTSLTQWFGELLNFVLKKRRTNQFNKGKKSEVLSSDDLSCAGVE